MPVSHAATLAFNRGLLSDLGLARVDITRYRMAAATMVNWIPRVLGSMILRPGTAYLTGTAGNAQARTIPFIFGAQDTARIEVTSGALRVLVNDALVTRPAVTTTVTNGTFATNLAGWTNSSEAGATVTWVSAGRVSFVGTGSNNAILDQQVTVSGGNVGVRHALRIVVTRGPITFRLGTSLGDDSLINETVLNTGTHSLAFTPAGNVWVRLQASSPAATLLASCTIEAAGVLTLPASWATADLVNLRWTQSGDVIYVGCPGGANGNGYEQQQIERRSVDSWSIVSYFQTARTGPFRPINTGNITLTPSATTGDITLTASKALFKPSHVGALFRLLSIGQVVVGTPGGAGQYTNPILVTGTGTSQRTFSIIVAGTWAGTLTLQYAFSPSGPWVDTTETFTNNTSTIYFDNANNQSIYYRIGFDPGNYTSGSANITLGIQSGSITGICRVTAYTSSTQVSASVLEALGATTATPNWYEGAWSTFRGFPSTCRLWQGRLWWFGSSVFGSVSDDYPNFDDTIVGDSAPIIGQLDEGAVENVYWAIGLQQLVLGTASAESSCRSTYLGDAVTPTNFNVITGGTEGSINCDALRLDQTGIFVQITGSRVFQLNLDVYTYSYRPVELTLFVPDLCAAGIVQIALQTKPDRRVHCLLADGTVAIMVFDPVENVNCWSLVTMAGGGFVEDISILPNSGRSEDAVYYLVRRVLGNQTVRYHERWAREDECMGLPLAKHADAHVVYQGAATTTIGGLSHLVGQTVCVWAWNTITPYVDGNGNTPGLDLGTYTVNASGQITGLNLEGTPYQVTNAIVGLAYTGQWQSMKQAFAAAMGTPLNQPKRITRLGLVLQNVHAQGLKIGNDFAHLDDLPQQDLPYVVTPLPNQVDSPGNVDMPGMVDASPGSVEMPDLNAVLPAYDYQMAAFNDIWSTDSRVCMQAASPRPCRALAFTVEMDTSG